MEKRPGKCLTCTSSLTDGQTLLHNNVVARRWGRVSRHSPRAIVLFSYSRSTIEEGEIKRPDRMLYFLVQRLGGIRQDIMRQPRSPQQCTQSQRERRKSEASGILSSHFPSTSFLPALFEQNMKEGRNCFWWRCSVDKC